MPARTSSRVDMQSLHWAHSMAHISIKVRSGNVVVQLFIIVVHNHIAHKHKHHAHINFTCIINFINQPPESASQVPRFLAKAGKHEPATTTEADLEKRIVDLSRTIVVQTLPWPARG